jgi:hypothetical protein
VTPRTRGYSYTTDSTTTIALLKMNDQLKITEQRAAGRPIPVAERSNAYVCGRSLDGIRVRIPPGHGYLSVSNVVRCQVETSTTGRSLVQGGATTVIVTRCNNNPLHLQRAQAKNKLQTTLTERSPPRSVTRNRDNPPNGHKTGRQSCSA